MRYDTNGYVCVNGSTDAEDSSHLVGLLMVTQYPIKIDWDMYIKPNGKYQRCKDSKYDFSRDQFLVMAAGMIKSGHGHLVSLDRVDGKDLMPFSVRGLVRIAHGKKPRFYQSWWLTAEIYWHSYLQPLDEPNQIIALCSVYGDKYLKLWTKHNKFWEWSITFYFGGYSRDEFVEMLKADKKMGFFRKWFLVRYVLDNSGNWRGEKELAEFIIQKIKEKI
jgi:hypothetical protein